MTSNVHSSESSTKGWKDDVNVAYKRENRELKVKRMEAAFGYKFAGHANRIDKH